MNIKVIGGLSFLSKKFPSSDAKVSVVIPTFNNARHIKKCIKGIKQQRFHDLEVIFVDDGSTDETNSILSEIVADDQRFRVITLKKNKGLNKAIAEGIKNATGSFLCLMTDHDPVEPSFIQESYDALQKFPDAAFSFSDPAEYDENEDKITNVKL